MDEEMFDKLCDIFQRADATWARCQAALADGDMDTFRQLKAEHEHLAVLYRATHERGYATIN
jgi:hypothetical protein